MAGKTDADTLDQYMRRFERKLPRSIARALRWTRQPPLIWVRVPVASLLMVGGVFSFLPVLGIWMAPLGLLLLAQDVAFLQRPVITALEWVEECWKNFRWRRSK
jgi:hypothetical protein